MTADETLETDARMGGGGAEEDVVRDATRLANVGPAELVVLPGELSTVSKGGAKAGAEAVEPSSSPSATAAAVLAESSVSLSAPVRTASRGSLRVSLSSASSSSVAR